MATLGPIFDLNRRGLITGALTVAALPLLRPAIARGIPEQATQEDARFMRMALDEAAKADFPFGAVITGNGEVLARGHNLGKQEQDPTAHGEMVAIRNFLKAHGPEKLKSTTLYTSGEPCPMCMGATIWCGVGRIVYGASIAELATKINQIMLTSTEIADKTPFLDIKITGGVLAKESLALFK